jgi:hypothetical protein
MSHSHQADCQLAAPVLSDRVAALLPGIFTNPVWRKLDRHRRFAVIDGMKVGVILATKSQWHTNHALSNDGLERLLAGKRAGKIDLAYVVFTESSSGYCAHVDAEHLRERLNGFKPRIGQFGEFWTLPPWFAVSSEHDPF